MTYAERIDTAANAALLLQQWRDTPRLRALAEALLGIIDEELLKPLAVLEGQMGLDTAQGVWLDHIGARLGLPRPATLSTDFDFFGFDGSGGVGFDQGLLTSVNPALSPRVPVGDDYYRRLIGLRVETILGNGTVQSLESAARKVFPQTQYRDHGDMTFTVVGVPAEDELRTVVDSIGAWPSVSGGTLIVEEQD